MSNRNFTSRSMILALASVRFASVPDAEDAHGFALQSEQHAVIAEAEPERTSHVAVQRHDLPAAGVGEMEDALEDTHRGRLVQGTNIRLGFVEPFDPIRRHLLSDRDVFRFEPELGKNLFHRNSLAAALREPSLPITEAATVFFRDRLVIYRASSRIDHDFLQTTNSCNLTRCETVYEFVNLLFLMSDVRWHSWREPSVHSTAVDRIEDAEARWFLAAQQDSTSSPHSCPTRLKPDSTLNSLRR